MRPRGPTAHPACGDAKPTLQYARLSRRAQLRPSSSDRSAPPGPTATIAGTVTPGTYAAPYIAPANVGRPPSDQLRPPSAVIATYSPRAAGLPISPPSAAPCSVSRKIIDATPAASPRTMGSSTTDHDAPKS